MSPNALDHQADRYQSTTIRPTWWRRSFPSFFFYQKFVRDVWSSSRQAKRETYDNQAWADSSLEVLRSLERVGVTFHIDGLQHLRSLDSAAVFVGNHMSMLETMVLPCIIEPLCDVTFIVKESLLEYPLFCHIMRSRDPIAVGRENPREDLKLVMSSGVEKLTAGTSIVVFPQTTRQVEFDPKSFNSIGSKLAKRAGVPVIPIALQTDAWQNGRHLKDLGPIDVNRPVRFSFGAAIPTDIPASEVQTQVITHIQDRLHRWR